MKTMKHIRRKFLRADKVNFDAERFLDSVPITDTTSSTYKIARDSNYYPVIITEQNNLIQAFFYEASKKNFIIPEPNLITVYFDIAQSQIRHAHLAKAELLTNIDRNGDVSVTLNSTHTFFHHTCICILFMYNSIEAFINLLLPVDKEYIRVDKKNTSHFSHEQIQREISIEEKIKSVLPQFLGRSFQQDYGHKYDAIIKLKEMRDEIAHTKAYAQNNSRNFYRQIFTNLLNFNLDYALINTRDFINYFEPDMIEECDCGKKE